MDLHEISNPLDGAKAGQLYIPHGAAEFDLAVLTDADELFRAQLAGPDPKVDVDNGRVTISYPRFSVSYIIHRPQTSHMALNSHIPWRIEVGQGIKGLRGDLRELTFEGLDVNGGAVDVDLTLPEPSGNIAIRFKGGVKDVTLRRPKGTEARLAVKGGATHIKFDAQTAGAIGGGLSWQSSGFDDAADRYDIEIGGGAVHVTVE